MDKADVFVHGKKAGVLVENERARNYTFIYLNEYEGIPVSMTMPISQSKYDYEEFPPFFDGLLPEGYQLDALLKNSKIDRNDYFRQLVAVGKDLVGAVTVEPVE